MISVWGYPLSDEWVVKKEEKNLFAFALLTIKNATGGSPRVTRILCFLVRL